MKLIFKVKVELESGNQKIQYGRQAAILKVTSLKINRLLPMATINMHMKFAIEIPKQTWLMLWKPCRLQTDGQTDRRTDKVNPVYPPSNFVERGYNNAEPLGDHWTMQHTWGKGVPWRRCNLNGDVNAMCTQLLIDIYKVFNHHLYPTNTL